MSEDHLSADVPESGEPDAEVTPVQRAEAKIYGRRRLFCQLADRAVDLGYLGLMAFLFARPIDAWLGTWERMADAPFLRLAVLYLLVYLLHLAISFPLTFYAGFIQEHRFGLSRLSLGGWWWRYVKQHALALGFGLLVFLGLYWLIWSTGSYWWLVAAAAAFVMSVLVGQLVPVLIIPLFYKVERYEDETISPRLKQLAAGTGLQIEGVYRLQLSDETVKANAALTGLGRTRRVLLSDTLLANFTPEEIEVIFAHEVGHHVYRHIPKLILFGVVYSLIGFWLSDRILMNYVHTFNPTATQAILPVWTLPLLMLTITLFSLLLEPLQNALSRHFERQCDRYALERTGLRAAYISAFQKLSALNKEDPEPHPVEVFWLHNHPAIAERIAMAEHSNDSLQRS